MTDNLKNMAKWFEDHPNWSATLLILLAGSLGGIFSSYVYLAVGKVGFPDVPWYIRIILGFFAAGFGAVLFAIARREDFLHFFFVALASALAFPAVLNQVFPQIDSEQIQKTENVENVDAATVALEETDASQLTEKGKNVVQAQLAKPIQEKSEEIIASAKILDNSEAATEQISKDIDELKTLGQTAGNKGYEVTKVEVISNLQEVAKHAKAPEVKQKAEAAIEEIGSAATIPG